MPLKAIFLVIQCKISTLTERVKYNDICNNTLVPLVEERFINNQHQYVNVTSRKFDLINQTLGSVCAKKNGNRNCTDPLVIQHI